MSFRGNEDHFRDILQAIDLIEQFVYSMDITAYQNDPKTRAAVEREFSILSEAAYRLGSDAENLCPGPDWNGLRGMGNVLRHAYHRTNDEIIWNAVQIELSPLREAVNSALARLLKNK